MTKRTVFERSGGSDQCKFLTQQRRIQGGWGALGSLCPPPSWDFFFFYQSVVYEQEISIKRVRNLSQNAGNGILKTQIFRGNISPEPPRKLAPSLLVGAPPFKSPGSAPALKLNIKTVYVYTRMLGI